MGTVFTQLGELNNYIFCKMGTVFTQLGELNNYIFCIDFV
jgi:hypothetical protein